jgi:hypothetical protein
MASKTASPPDLNVSLLRSRLKLKNLQSGNTLRAHHPQAVGLLESAGIHSGSLRAHAAKLLSAGAAVGTFLVTAPASVPVGAALPDSSHQRWVSPVDFRDQVKNALKTVLPNAVQPLSSATEERISTVLHETLGIHALASLEGNHLNTSYGFIGQEQHLPRYPGDTVFQHDALPEYGLTPGRGAWGYFAASVSDLTPELVQMEKYYVAVQTLYLADWETRLPYLRDWYRFRKVVVINPKNGRSVVATIADSGPAAWTGKQFGGSPEVMDYLRMQDGRQRGPVILFFVDDPDKKVPFGPLEYNLEQGPPLLLSS